MRKTKAVPLQGVSDAILGGLMRKGMTRVTAAETVFKVDPRTLRKWLDAPERMPLGALLNASKSLNIPIETIRECIK